MAYPDNIDEFRTIENLPGLIYNPDDTKTLFAEDLQQIQSAVVAVENTLGTSPLWDYPNLGTALEEITGRLDYIEARLLDGATGATNEINTNQTYSGGSSFGDLETVGPSVTLTVPSSGKVLISWSAQTDANGIIGFAMSGANTAAATADRIAYSQVGGVSSNTMLLTGLTPGSTTFRLKYQTNTFFLRRKLTVIPVGF